MKKLKTLLLSSIALLLVVIPLKLFASQLPYAPSSFETALAFPISTSDTSMTLVTNTLGGGNTLTNGYNCFTIDQGQSNTEYVCGTVAGTTVSSLTRGIDLITGNTSNSSLIFSHRRGADIKITDFPILTLLRNIINGSDTIQNIISYTTHPTFTTNTQIVDKGYVDGVAIAGGANASSTVKGISKLSIDPVSPTNPIAVGDNDTRVPTVNMSTVTTGQVQALAGTSGTPSSSNKYVTNADTATTSTNNAVVRANASGLIDQSFISSATLSFTAGEAITAGNALVVSPYYQSDGGVKLDNQNSFTYAGTTNQTQAFTVANNSNRELLVAVSSSGVPSSVTYNGVAMTLVDSQVLSAGSNTLYVYKLVAPATGANNIVVTATGIGGISAASYYNVNQTTPVEASVKSNSGNSSLTTVSQGAFIHIFGAETNSAGSISAYTASHSSKYSSSVTDTPVGSYASASAISTTSAGEFNQTLTSIIPLTGFTGGSGTVGVATMALSLAPATTMSIGVFKANTSSIVNNEPLTKFVGFANANASANTSVVVTISGTVTGLSSLTPGVKYFLQNTPGTIGTSIGTYGKAIGTALTATTLLIGPEKTLGTAISKSNSYTYTAETDGFAGTATATFPVYANSTYSFPSGTNFFTPLN